MIGTIRLLLLGVAAFLLILVFTAPATLLTKQIEQYTEIRFESVKGSLWRGSAERVIMPQTSIGPLYWNIKPSRLLFGRLSADIELKSTEKPGIQGTASIATTLLGKVFVHNAKFLADAEWVVIQLTLPIAAGGNMDLNINELIIERNRLPRIDAELNWQQAMITYPEVIDLGAFQLTVVHQPSDNPERVLGVLKDINSPLTIDGDARLTADQKYTAELKVNTRPDAPQSLQNVLPLLPGIKNPDGSVTIRRSGIFSLGAPGP